jgi:pSer/pThr/pTyr-binding forkhead associated (FHA) protein
MPAKVSLTILGGALDGTEFEFDKPNRCVIGRSEDCSVRLPNRGWAFQMVSRHHCQLDIDPPRIQVCDLGSRNGTYVNDRLIGLRAAEELPELAAAIASWGYGLHDEDILGIGPVHFRVNVKGAERAKAESADAACESRTPEAKENGGSPEEEMMFAI